MTLGDRLLVEPGEITAADLARILAAPSRLPEGWDELPMDAVLAHIRGSICPDEQFRVLDWHVYEINHVNRRKHPSLRWPVIAHLVRDQHEINRLILISIEKTRELLIRIEAELGRLFGQFRQADRSHWVRQFRFLGTRWSLVNNASRELRDAWEQGRNLVHRMWSRADQEAINTLIEINLCALSEAISVLMAIPASEQGCAMLQESGEGRDTQLYNTDLEPHIESCLWHAREGQALRSRWNRQNVFIRKLRDHQPSLNHIYSISLLEMSFILKELSEGLGRIGMWWESSNPGKPE